jgi:hypothetical protein
MLQDPAALGGKLTADRGLPVGGHGPYALDAGSTTTGLHAQLCNISVTAASAEQPSQEVATVMLHIAQVCVLEA